MLFYVKIHCTMKQLNRENSKRYCSYKGCSSDRIKTRDGAITFFGFPVKDTERCSVWITNSGREEFRYLTPRELADKRLCEFHFADSMFSNNFKTNLKKHAVPLMWRHPPELIQIDDDEDQSVECETVIINEGSNNTNVPYINGQLINSSRQENEHHIVVPEVTSILNSVLTNGGNAQPTRPTQEPPTESSTSVERQFMLVSSTIQGHNGTHKQSPTVQHAGTTEKASGSVHKKNTKFHNLPPQAANADFYYQQCPSAEETNNSFPEPPEGELPLFVQQNSVASMADDAANSDISEPVSKKRRFDRDSDDLAEQMKEAMKHLKNITSLLTTSEDEFELFGKSVALQLKKMSLCTALTAQAKIQQLLSQHRISDIKKVKREKQSVSDQKSEGNQTEEVIVEVIEGETEAEGEECKQVEPVSSPQLSLDCASEASDNETNEMTF